MNSLSILLASVYEKEIVGPSGGGASGTPP